jgi:hypothetical protein
MSCRRPDGNHPTWTCVLIATCGPLAVSWILPASTRATTDPPVGTPSAASAPIPVPALPPWWMITLMVGGTVAIAVLTTLTTLYLCHVTSVPHTSEEASPAGGHGVTHRQPAGPAPILEADLDLLENGPGPALPRSTAPGARPRTLPGLRSG